MKAAWFYGPGDIRILETERPGCPPGGALVQLDGSLICGTDVKIYKGGHPRITTPQIIGHESCGRIVELKDSTSDLKVGDRVTVQTSLPCGKCELCQQGLFNLCQTIEAISWGYPGTFAEFVAIPAKAMALGNLVKVPDSLSDEVACLAEPLACCINGQELLKIVPGESVLIVGAGPIGILQAELARMSGAGRIILAQRSETRMAMARRFEYSDYIDTSKNDLVAEVKRLTGGKGVNVAIVTAPVKEAMEQALETLATRGRLSLFSSLPVGASGITLDSRIIHYKEVSVYGASSSTARQLQKALDLLATRAMRTDQMVTHRLPLLQFEQGLQLAKSGKALKVYISNSLKA